MCVIIHVPAGVMPDPIMLERAFNANKDGWGIMFAYEQELYSFKDVTKFDAFLSVWETCPTDVDRFIHFRIKTHGAVSQLNCHPFSVNTGAQELLMMHNGIVDVSEVDPAWSDSWHFAKLISGMYMGQDGFLDLEENQKHIAKATQGSRLVFLDKTGKIYKFGTWQEKYGLSFSNLYFDFPKIDHTKTSCGVPKLYAPYYGCSDGLFDDDYDSWGNYIGADRVSSETPTGRSVTPLTTSTSDVDPETDYKQDSIEEAVDRIESLLEDNDMDDAVAVIQFNQMTAKDIGQWFGAQSVLDVLDHILNGYVFHHSSDKTGA